MSGSCLQALQAWSPINLNSEIQFLHTAMSNFFTLSILLIKFSLQPKKSCTTSLLPSVQRNHQPHWCCPAIVRSNSINYQRIMKSSINTNLVHKYNSPISCQELCWSHRSRERFLQSPAWNAPINIVVINIVRLSDSKWKTGNYSCQPALMGYGWKTS